MPLVYPMPRICHLPERIPDRSRLVRQSPWPMRHSGPRPPGKTRFALIHMTAGGSALSSIDWLRTTANSYHYIIEDDGIIWRCLPWDVIAHHAGDSQWLGSDGSTMNDESLGFALANRNDGTEPVTMEAYLSLVWLSAVAMERYPESLTSVDYFRGHREVAPSRRRDPDPDVFDLPSFRVDLFAEVTKRGIIR